MVTHSGTLAWETPWTEEPGGLQSTGSQSRTRLSNFTFTFILPPARGGPTDPSPFAMWQALDCA